MSERVKIKVEFPVEPICNINWRVGKPQRTGDYLVIHVNDVGGVHCAELAFSAKHGAWNCFDSMEAPNEASEGWDVLFWVPLGEILPNVEVEKEVEA